jgi:hypothetical protein
VRHLRGQAPYAAWDCLQNDAGLLSEEYDLGGGHMLRNFPQAFSHVGVIITALNLARSVGPSGEPAEREADVQKPARAV